MAGKGGGAWKVAYADFVTAMMAFFLVMWITAQSKSVKEAVQQYFTDPYGTRRAPIATGIATRGSAGSTLVGPLQSGRGPGRGTGRAGARLVKSPDGTERKPTLSITQDENYSRTGTAILFAEDSTELTETAQDQLRQLIPLLIGKTNKLEIRGHASRRPLPPASPYRDAWELSYARCLATMHFLEKQGIQSQRIRLSQAGAFEPLSLEASSLAQAENSRVEVYTLSEQVQDFMGSAAGRAAPFGPALPPRQADTSTPLDK